MASLILRLFFQLIISFPGIRDSYQYSALIRNVAEGKGLVDYYIWHDMIRYASIPHPHDWMPFLYPALSAMIALLGVSSFVAGKLISVGAGSLLSAGAYLVGRELGGKRVGLLSAFLAAFSPPLLFYSCVAMTDMLFCLLAAISTFLILRAWGRESDEGARRWAVAGAAAGLSYLCRPTAVLLPLALAAGWLVSGKLFRLNALRNAAIVALSFLVVASPWLVRNYLLLGDPFASVPGYHLWTTHEGAYYDFDYQRVKPLTLLSDPGTWRSSFSYLLRILLDLSFVVPICGLAVLGMALICSRTDRGIFVLIYILFVFALAGFNRSGGTWVRHVLPAVPLLLVGAAYATVEFSEKLEKTGTWKLRFRGIGILSRSWVVVAVSALAATQTLAFAWAYWRGHIDFTEMGRTSYARDFDTLMRNVSAWLSTNTDPDDVVMTRHPWHINYYSGRKAVSAVNGPSERIGEIASTYHVTLLIVDAWATWPDRYRGPYADLAANRSVTGFSLLARFRGPIGASIFLFNPQEYLQAENS